MSAIGFIPPSCRFPGYSFHSLAGMCFRIPLGTGNAWPFIFLAFGPDLLASSVVDMPHSFRLKGSNAEDFTPPSRSLAAHPRPCLGGESRASGPYPGKALPGLAQMKLRREGIWEGGWWWSRARKALGGWSFSQDGGKVPAA